MTAAGGAGARAPAGGDDPGAQLFVGQDAAVGGLLEQCSPPLVRELKDATDIVAHGGAGNVILRVPRGLAVQLHGLTALARRLGLLAAS